MAECTACHDTVPYTHDAGPHGMHTVCQSEVYPHSTVANHDRALCKACHGDDYRGSILSRASAERSYTTSWGTTKFKAGHMVSCYDCYDGPEGY